MHRPLYHRKKSHFKKLLKFIFVCAAGYACWLGYQKYSHRFELNIQRINEQSVLKGRTFDKTVQEIVTPSGLNFWLIEDHSIPIVSMDFMFEHSGTAYDNNDKQGLAMLTAELMPLGAGDNNRFKISEILEMNGIHITFGNGREDFNGSLIVPSKNLQQGVSLLHDILSSPMLNKKDLELLKVQALEALKMKTELPKNRLQKAFREKIYGLHQYARDSHGSIDGIANVTQEDVQNFIKNNLARDNLIIGMAGDITPKEAIQVVETVFAKLPKQSQQTQLTAPELNLDGSDTHVEYLAAQVDSIFAVSGVERQHEDFYPLYIANHIFGGSGLNSKLSLEAREKRGLTYGVYTWLSTDEKAPLIIGSFSTSPENFEKMQEIVRDEWRKFAQNGVTEAEFNFARDYLLASYNLRFDSTTGLSGMLVQMQKHKLGADFLQKRNSYIQALTIEDVNKAAAKYFAKLPTKVSLGKLNKNEEK